MKSEKIKTSQAADPQIMPLDTMKAGRTVRISRIDSGHHLNNRLAAMGLLKHTEITVVRNDGAGQIIIAVKNSKIILGRGMSHKVFVTRI